MKKFKSFKVWLAERRRDEKLDLRGRGYTYAAGEMLRGKSPVYLQSEYECIDKNEFDQGIRHAVEDAIDKGWVEDDRVEYEF